MSNFSGYKTKAFSEGQKFFVLDPQAGSPSFVKGSDLVDQLTPNSNYVFSESTRISAQAADYPIGSLIETTGALSIGDDAAAGYVVVAGGQGDFPMQNGNDLLIIKGDELLREQLSSSSASQGSDLVAHAGTANTVTDTLDQNIADIATNEAEISKRTAEIEIDASGSSGVTITADQSKYSIIELTGAITADINAVVPDAPRLYTIVNNTTGSFTVTVKTSAGAGVVVPQGEARIVRSDGANVVEGLQYKLDANDALGGAAQSWQDVTASRIPEVTYTNSTGRPIFVSVYTDAVSAGTAISVVVDGFIRFRDRSDNPTETKLRGGTTIVPDGSTYSVALEGFPSINRWSELR